MSLKGLQTMCEKKRTRQEITREAQRKYRERLKKKGKRGRLIYLTNEEYEEVKRFIKDLRND